jgi:4-amino-4-deoxy-L-arabinose transferase-like glycosyltransferase
MKNKDKLLYLVLIILAFAVNLAGINVKFFTDDQGLYASIAKNMVYRKEFFELFSYNRDWLDKPHFPFWMIAASFKLFGFSVWAYRLPALLFFTLSVVYTYLFTRRYYNWEIAAIAVLILMTAQYTLMGNTDVRAEPYLMGLITGSIYHIARLEDRFTFTDLLLAALLTACAVMTKGIFVIIVVYGGLLGQLLFQKKIVSLFSLKWIGLFLLTLIFILPEFYALYIQFDLHPEKIVFDRHGVSGVKWFLWDSQFGRFVNTGPISRNKGGDLFFYLHTLLWAFAPWCLLFYYAVYKRVQGIFKRRKLPEYYTISGGLLLLILFSLSGFQLPFYTNAIFPLFAIIMAPFCYNQLPKFDSKFRLMSQWIYITLFTLIVFIINFFLKPASSLFFIIDCAAFFLLISLISYQIKESHKKAILLSCAAVLFADFYLITILYPVLTSCNGQITAANYINQDQFNQYHIYSVKMQNNVFQFECKRPVDYMPLEQLNRFVSKGNSVFYITQYSLNYLVQNHVPYKVLQSFQNYPQERLLPLFINRDTRSQVLDTVYLISK